MLKKHQKTIKFTSPQNAHLDDLAELNNSTFAEENRKIIDLHRQGTLLDSKSLVEIAKLNKRIDNLIAVLTEDDDEVSS